VPRPSAVWTLVDDEDTVGASGHHMDVECNSENDPKFQPVEHCQPHLIFQSELNDLMRDFNLFKSQAKLLGSRIKEWNLLSACTKISFFAAGMLTRSGFFYKDDTLHFCMDVSSLLRALVATTIHLNGNYSLTPLH
jgi:hypothetical protein